MITLIRKAYRALAAQQERKAVLIALSSVSVIVCAVVFGRLYFVATAIEDRRPALVNALVEANLEDETTVGPTLASTGVLEVDGYRYELDDDLRERSRELFDPASGRIFAPVALTNVLMAPHVPAWAPHWLRESKETVMVLGAATLGWLLLVILLRIPLQAGLTVLGTGVPFGIASALGATTAMWVIGGVGLLTFTYMLLVRGFLLLYSVPRQIPAVAATVLREATRTRVPLLFIIALLVLLPLIPVFISPEDPLRFRIQTFISRSMGLTFYLASCMTIVLACATVAFEIRDRQIWQLVTKPMGRFNYLLGKWLGIVSLNVVLVTIASVSMFLFIQYQRRLPIESSRTALEDARQVETAVLTARVNRYPTYETLSKEQIQARVEERIKNEAQFTDLESVPAAEWRMLAREEVERHSAGQRSIMPQQSRQFVFRDLDRAKALGVPLTLRYRFHILRDDEHETFTAFFMFNDDQQTMRTEQYVPTMAHSLDRIPSEWINDDGELTVTVANGLDPRLKFAGNGAMNWEFDDFELLFEVGSFEANFFRAILVNLVRLAFLAMLGIACATFLSFPVACLMSFTIFVAGTAAPFLAQSLNQWVPPDATTMDWGNIGMVIKWAVMSVLSGIARAMVWLVGAFGQTQPTDALVQGRLLAWPAVIMSIVRIGLVWSGIALLVGYLVLRSRQLAIYSGNG